MGELAYVAWRFWLLSNKGGRGQKNREEIGAGATQQFVRSSTYFALSFQLLVNLVTRTAKRMDLSFVP